SVDQWAAWIAADYLEVDHRTQGTIGRDEYLRTLRMYAAIENVIVDQEPLASLGERHALVRRSWRFAGVPLSDKRNRTGDAEVVVLQVVRTNPAGLVVRIERFHPED